MKLIRPLCFALVLMLCTTFTSAANDNFGRFVGDVITKWLGDGRKMEVLQDFRYIDPSGVEWLAPKGAIVDGASIPKPAWSGIGGPFEGKYRSASVIHDVACVEKKRPWQDVHKAFYFAMLAGGVSSLKARIMYAAVYAGGPRWRTERMIAPGSRVVAAQNILTEKLQAGETVSFEVEQKYSALECPREGCTKVITATYSRISDPEFSDADYKKIAAIIEANDLSPQEIAEDPRINNLPENRIY